MREFFEGLLHQAAVAGDNAALVSANGALSYRALVERVRGHAQWATRLPHRIGLFFMKGMDYVVCDLALSFAGKELVPLPEFFSDAQLLHIAQVAQLSDVVADKASAERAKRLGLTVHELDAQSVTNNAPASAAGRIIFTSGTTGKPKGVCLSERQLLASVAALAEASHASATDRYLSVLPNSLLLEQIGHLPAAVGWRGDPSAGSIDCFARRPAHSGRTGSRDRNRAGARIAGGTGEGIAGKRQSGSRFAQVYRGRRRADIAALGDGGVAARAAGL